MNGDLKYHKRHVPHTEWLKQSCFDVGPWSIQKHALTILQHKVSSRFNESFQGQYTLAAEEYMWCRCACSWSYFSVYYILVDDLKTVFEYLKNTRSRVSYPISVDKVNGFCERLRLSGHEWRRSILESHWNLSRWSNIWDRVGSRQFLTWFRD